MLSLPNLLTLSRILAVPIFVFLLWKPAPWDYAITFVLYCIVGITDYFDGYLARAHGQNFQARPVPRSDRGQNHGGRGPSSCSWPRAKRTATCPIIQDLNVIPALIILLREIIVSGLREFLAGLQVSVPVSALAKWKTTFQLVALGHRSLAARPPINRGCTWSVW